MCRRGPIQPYLSHEVSTTNEPKESYYNMGLMGLMEDYKKKVLWALRETPTAQCLFGLNEDFGEHLSLTSR